MFSLSCSSREDASLEVRCEHAQQQASGDQEPGKKTVNFDINGSQQVLNIEVLKISKPIVSAGKMVRSGRRIVLDEHDSFIEDRKRRNESLWS